jgi:hypothetical protein
MIPVPTWAVVIAWIVFLTLMLRQGSGGGHKTSRAFRPRRTEGSAVDQQQQSQFIEGLVGTVREFDYPRLEEFLRTAPGAPQVAVAECLASRWAGEPREHRESLPETLVGEVQALLGRSIFDAREVTA